MIRSRRPCDPHARGSHHGNMFGGYFLHDSADAKTFMEFTETSCRLNEEGRKVGIHRIRIGPEMHDPQVETALRVAGGNLLPVRYPARVVLDGIQLRRAGIGTTPMQCFHRLIRNPQSDARTDNGGRTITVNGFYNADGKRTLLMPAPPARKCSFASTSELNRREETYNCRKILRRGLAVPE
jgi:hypothetical protein